MSQPKSFAPILDGESDVHRYSTPLERRVQRILSPFDDFVRDQVAASIMLFACTVLALVLINSPLTQYYQALVTFTLGFVFNSHILTFTLHQLVNDGLLVLFFFILGLEIKRELMVGELANPQRASIVFVGALGGMLMPASLFVLFNYDQSYASAWGIPIATDTAFALGILLLLRKRIPRILMTFFATMAVVDDIGAVMVIAFFYTPVIEWVYLITGLSLWLVLIFINFSGVRNAFIYLFIGIVIWYMIESAGLHASIAGVLVAFTIPARPKTGPRIFVDKVRSLLTRFEEKHQYYNKMVLEDEMQHEILQEVELVTRHASTPLQRWATAMEKPVALFVLPLFALVNAGVILDNQVIMTVFSQSLGLSIITSLVLGKFLGVAGFTWLALKLGLGHLPGGMTLRHVIGVSFLCGMGFTMSIFIAGLSFTSPEEASLLAIAKISVMIASLLAGILGYFWLRFYCKPINP
ncbi:MAG: Na+/H+ antiporter NhaA [Legionellales bacterium]|nr:Na+/H+ antiporter NhaA [Legionellales bacterium]